MTITNEEFCAQVNIASPSHDSFKRIMLLRSQRQPDKSAPGLAHEDCWRGGPGIQAPNFG